jgi:integrase
VVGSAARFLKAKTVHTVLGVFLERLHMPRLTNSHPRYRRHKASGQAVVTLNGTDIYLGPYGTKASRTEYDRMIGEWLAAGRHLPSSQLSNSDLTIVEILARYWRFASKHYCKDGEPTKEIDNIKCAAAPLKRLYGNTRAAKFGPLALKALQQRMIEDDLSRGVINGRIGRIKRIFRWAVSEQLCAPSVLHGLQSVMGRQRGRTDARETAPVAPVSDSVVEATLPHLPEVVADMVRLQWLVGCRPGEIRGLRPCDIDRSAEVWVYRPASHKTQHHGRARTIFIGPKAQEILRPYLLRDAETRCFTPIDSERRRKRELRERRKTPVQPSRPAVICGTVDMIGSRLLFSGYGIA